MCVRLLDELVVFFAVQNPTIADWTLYATIVTLVVLIWQSSETRRAVKIANKTLISTFRPKVTLRRVSLSKGTQIPTVGVPDAKPWTVDYAVANTGGTIAHVTSRSFVVKMFDDKELPPLLPYAPKAAESRFSLQPGEEKEFSVTLESELIFLFRLLGTQRGYLNNQKTAFVYFFGYIHYEDDLGVVRKMGALRHYDTGTGRFKTVDDPDYEYAD